MADFLLKEDGDRLLQENDDTILVSETLFGIAPLMQTTRMASWFATLAATTFSTFVFVPPPPPPSMAWYQPVSEPVRVTPRVVTVFTGAERPTLVPAPSPAQAFSSAQPAGFDSPNWQYQSYAAPVFVPVVAAPRGWEPMNADPVRRPWMPPAGTGAQQPVEVPESQHVTWFAGLSEPVRTRPRVADPLTGAERPIEIPESQHTTWYQPTSEPVRTKPRATSFATNAERVLEVPRSQHVTWRPEMQEPVRRIARTASFQTGGEWLPKVVVQVGRLDWSPQLSEPVRVARRVADPRTYAEAPPASLPRITRLDWCVAMAEPRRAARVADIRTYAEFVPVARRIDLAWYQPTPEPVRRLQRVADPSTGADRPTFARGQVRLEWTSPLAEPGRVLRLVDVSTGAERPLDPIVRPALPAFDWYIEVARPVWGLPRATDFDAGMAPVRVAVLFPPGILIGSLTSESPRWTLTYDGERWTLTSEDGRRTLTFDG